MKRKERVRFAPSPTGLLHIGNARTALFNYLFALNRRGTFILRIENTDVERSAPEYERSLIDALHWMRLEWQEGPDCGGPHAPYRQSERLELYREHALTLLKEGKAFKCYCTDEELEVSRKAMLRDGTPPRYSGRCRKLTADEQGELERDGRKPCIRYRVPDVGTVCFDDLIRGRMVFRADEIGDFVLIRSNGMPSYNFAAMIDDRSMEITTVIRGDDHLPNTPRQVLLYDTFGWPVPEFAHHPLLLGPDHGKLSKRHGVTSVEAFREIGIMPEALINYLALLGGSPVAGKEIFTPEELIRTFSVDKTGKSAAVFDFQRLLWVNQQHMRMQPPSELLSSMRPFLEKAGYATVGRDPEWLNEVALVLAENIRTFRDVSLYAPIFFRSVPEYDDAAGEEIRSPVAQRVLRAFFERFGSNPVNEPERFSEIVSDVRRSLGVDGKELFLPLRMALTGTGQGPELDRIVPLLSPAVIVERLHAALALHES